MQIGSWTRSRQIFLAIAVAAIPVTAGLMSGIGSEEPPSGVVTPSEEGDLEGVSKDAVTAFAGGEPDTCVFSGPDVEVCTWRLSGTLYQPGGRSDDTEGVNLVCELPLDGSSSGRCSAHGRRMGGLPPVSAGTLPPAIDEDAVLLAATRLSSAKTVRELSELVGDAPQDCLTGYETQVCAWHIRADAPSRQLFAGVADGSPLEIRCRLPLDGSPREFQSCSVVAVGVASAE